MKKSIILIYLILLANTGHTETFFAPFAFKYSGIGELYGVAVGNKDLLGKNSQLIGAISGGQVQAAGGMIKDAGIVPNHLRWNFAAGHTPKTSFQSYYLRGLGAPDRIYQQEIAASAVATSFDSYLFNQSLKWSIGVVSSTIKLKKYSIDGVEIVRPNTANYHDIKTLSLVTGLSLQLTSGEAIDQRGVITSINYVSAEGRAGQSDGFVINKTVQGLLPISNSLQLSLKGRFSDASVSKKNLNYLDSTAVSSALDTQCTSTECSNLETDLSSYIAQNNQTGTATPLGGNAGLRSYPELSLRASHTRLLSFETRWDFTSLLSSGKTLKLFAIPFYDLGYASDGLSNIMENSAYSYGLAIKFLYKTAPLQLTSAWGKDNYAWTFTMGQQF